MMVDIKIDASNVVSIDNSRDEIICEYLRKYFASLTTDSAQAQIEYRALIERALIGEMSRRIKLGDK